MKKLPIKKYKYTNYWDGTIQKVEIVRETELSVVLKGEGAWISTVRKLTKDTIYCDTPEEAFEWALNKSKKLMEQKHAAYVYYKKKYDDLVKKGIICKRK